MIAFSPELSISQGKTLSQDAEISILTCGPGTELYSSFGHNAIRVFDLSSGIDEVYNYGTFNFSTPNFYYKFASGKLLYSLSVSTYNRFLFTYDIEKRWVKEQLLDLSEPDKQDFYKFLQINRLPENRDYQYDFLFDNCATKLPEVLTQVMPNRLQFSDEHLESKKSFRDLIQENLSYNTWASFGIDLALGAVIDREAKPYEYMFLPNYVRLQLENTTLDNRPLVSKSIDVLKFPENRPETIFSLSPIFWFVLLLIFSCFITYKDYKKVCRNRWFDFILFLITGLAGCLIFFLWFMTDHSSTAQNYNILWAMPLNLFIAFQFLKKKNIASWVYNYLLILIFLIFLVVVLWLFRYQVFSPLLVFILAILVLRYSYLYRLNRHKQ
nr:DUF4105 domain-containing protein [Eudoraea chungangensis]